MIREENHIKVWERSISDRRKSTYQNLQVGTSLVCSRNRKKINVAVGFESELYALLYFSKK